MKIKAVLVGGAAAAAIAAALSGAGTANASCASLNGHGIGQGCTSTVGSASIALGANARADSAGPGSVAVAVGNPGPNPFYPGVVLPTHADARGTLNGSFAFGDGSNAGSLAPATPHWWWVRVVMRSPTAVTRAYPFIRCRAQATRR